MATKKKLLQAAAGNAGGEALSVENVFSTYLYDGNSTARSISNGIDLSGEGGLVWTKLRGPNTSTRHVWIDTVRGVEKYLESNTTDAEDTQSGNSLTAFNSNGYSVGNWGSMNASGQTYASWTFRKAPKFFDVQTFTYSSGSATTINHSLNCEVGMVIIKRTDSSDNWYVQHRSNTGSDSTGILNGTAAFNSPNGYSNWIATFGTTSLTTVTNQVSGTYVAYIFAHNDGDGEFGPDGDADIIKCGSFTGNGSATGPSVSLGFEPQWLLIRNVDRADDWVLIDSMRGIPSSSDGPAVLRPESSAAEYASGSSFSQSSRVDLTATGFDVKSSNSRVNGSSQNMIYMAIRRGTAVPESATDVFAISQQLNTSGGTPSYNSGFPVDMAINKYTTGTDAGTADRLRGARDLQPAYNFAEYANSVKTFDYMDGYYNPGAGANSNYYSWMWKRAPNFFDVVAYTGNGTAGRTVAHNLGVAPEMMWVKRRNTTGEWPVYHKDLPIGDRALVLQTSSGTYASEYWNNQNPTSTTFPLGASSNVNASGSTYIAYLFASLDGISKVGSVTHSGTTNVDCGFSSGARFVLLKRTDATGDWYVWDSERGIVSGNDPYLLLNSTAAEVTNTDYIDPLSSGFTITSNFTAGDYIFYAIA